MAPGVGPTVRAIEVKYVGAETVSRERVLANLKTQVGRPYSERDSEDDVRALFASGDVANVRIFAEPVADGVKVTVLLQGRPVVTEIVFEGGEAIKTARLRRELTFKVGDRLSEEQVERSRQKMVEVYEDLNYGAVQITYKITTDDKAGTSRVVFTLDEGAKQVVRRVSFTGNEAVQARDLRKVLKTRPQNILSVFNKSGRLVPAQLEEDRNAIRLLYQNRGFADVQVTDVQVQPLGGNGVEVIFAISEGVQYNVGQLTITGVQIIPVPELESKLSMVAGSLYTPKGLSDDLKTLRDFYGTQGYIDASIVPEINPVSRGTVNITYRIEEGTQSYINLINIQGNERTKDRVIRRELAVQPGEVFDSVLVDVSRTRLDNLNYFSKVDMVPMDTLVPGRKDLTVIVEEKRTGSFNFGAGFSTIDSLIGFAELQQTNFDLLGWPSFVGAGQRFRTRVQYGIERSDFVMSLTEPWFLGQQLSLGGEGYYREASFLSTEYLQANYGFALQLRKPFGEFLAVNVEYRIEGINIYDVPRNATEDFKSQEGLYTKSAVTAGLTFDSRDSLFLTRRGTYANFTSFVSGGGLGGTVQDYGLSLEASHYVSLPWDLIFLAKGQLAVVDTWGGSDEVPIFDRLYLGGANNLRGFDFRDVGPTDSQGNPIGGNSLGYMTFEVTFPVITRVRGAVFTDLGFVNAPSWDFDAGGYNSDFGFGIRLDLPIGPVRIDYGIPVTTNQYNGGSGKFNFNIGYQF